MLLLFYNIDFKINKQDAQNEEEKYIEDISFQAINTNLQNIPLPEWLALKDLYYSLNGNEWKWRNNINSTYWNFTNYFYNNPCFDKWEGIVCTCHHYIKAHYYSTYYPNYYYSESTSYKCNIEKLVLINHNLIGSLPTTFFQLTYLKKILFHKNYIHGTIPNEIGKMTNLSTIGFIHK